MTDRPFRERTDREIRELLHFCEVAIKKFGREHDIVKTAAPGSVELRNLTEHISRLYREASDMRAELERRRQRRQRRDRRSG